MDKILSRTRIIILNYGDEYTVLVRLHCNHKMPEGTPRAGSCSASCEVMIDELFCSDERVRKDADFFLSLPIYFFLKLVNVRPIY